MKTTPIKNCDICESQDVERVAHYDGKTVFGPWANMCEAHFKILGFGLGLGYGQKINQEDESYE